MLNRPLLMYCILATWFTSSPTASMTKSPNMKSITGRLPVIAMTAAAVEGERERTQVFEGVCIRIQRKGSSSNFTVRRVTQGIGIERTSDGRRRTAILSADGRVFLARVGDEVMGRFQVRGVTDDAVELLDLSLEHEVVDLRGKAILDQRARHGEHLAGELKIFADCVLTVLHHGDGEFALARLRAQDLQAARELGLAGSV